MHLSSTSGANELMEFSRTRIVQAFSAALHDLPHSQAPDSLNSIALLLGGVDEFVMDEGFGIPRLNRA